MTSDTFAPASFRNAVRIGKDSETKLDWSDPKLTVCATRAHARATEADRSGAAERMIPYPSMKEMAPDESGGLEQAYTRLFELGRGGMARVYLAESHAFGLRKLVVLKILNPEFNADLEVRASFRREAELSAQMNHPNVVQVMAVDEYAGMPAIVMEYLDGLPLSSLLRNAGKDFPLRLRMYILSQVLAGLHHFHELRDLDGAPLCPVHRDVSPQNIMILHDGPVKVLDFGIAKISATDKHATRTGTVKGKIHYMPPEQLLDGAHVDRRADIFAVGVMLWEAVADRRMWQGKTEVELLRSLATGSLPNLRDAAPDVPEPVLSIVKRATELERCKRFESALEMQVAIDRASTQEGWIVQPRELAEYMARHFGEQRQEQDLRIKSALRAQRYAEARADQTPRTRVVPKTPPPLEPEKPPVRSSDLAVARTLWRGRRGWGWALALAACAALAGAWTIRQQRIALTRAGEQAPTNTAMLEIEAHPAGAEIYLGGKFLAKDHFLGEQPLSDAKMVLEVSAPGHVSQRREISLRKDLALQIVLEPDPGETNQPGAPAAASARPSMADTSARRHTASVSQVRSAPKSTHKVVVSGADRARRCKPPYTLGADGVKTYKPECF